MQLSTQEEAADAEIIEFISFLKHEEKASYKYTSQRVTLDLVHLNADCY